MMFARLASATLAGLVAAPWIHADTKKLSDDQRMEIMRGISSEYAKVKVHLPRSKKALDYHSNGTWDRQQWADADHQYGPAARLGDLVQVTKVDIGDDHIVLQINGGLKTHSDWKNHVQVGINGGMGPLVQNQSNAPSGTTIDLKFDGPIGSISSTDIKKMLAPILDFEIQSAAQDYVASLPPEIKKAVEEKKPIEGMTRDQVLLAMGTPDHKTRETKDGVEYEDWIYGIPPGRVTFVTFGGPKVVKIKDSYAGLGGSIADPPKTP